MKIKTHCAKLLHDKVPLFLSIMILIFCIMACLGWFLHLAFPPSSPAPLNNTAMHSHVDLPPHLMNRRKEFFNNTFISTLHQHQLVINKTNCWVCGLMPHSVHGGMPFIPLPFGYAGSTYALSMIFSASVRNIPETPIKNASTWNEIKTKTVRAVARMVTFTATWGRADISENTSYSLFNDTTSFRETFSVQKRQTDQGDWAVPHQGLFCVRGKGKGQKMGDSECNKTYTLPDPNFPTMATAPNTYFICGSHARTWLPQGWSGKCYIAFLLPPTYTAPADYHLSDPPTVINRRRRGAIDAEDTAGQEAGDFFKGVIPFWGPMINSRHIRQLTRVVQGAINETAGALSNITAEMAADRLMTLQNRMVLDIILADRGGVCELIGSSCCIFIPDNAPSVYAAISRLHILSRKLDADTGAWSLTGWLWSLLSSWGWKVLTVLGLALAILFTCCLCIQCGPALCSFCITTCIPKTQTRKKERERIMLQEQVNDLMSIEVD
ncbi:uncharacterized protein LOC144753959 [Lissotriton helveticus]